MIWQPAPVAKGNAPHTISVDLRGLNGSEAVMAVRYAWPFSGDTCCLCLFSRDTLYLCLFSRDTLCLSLLCCNACCLCLLCCHACCLCLFCCDTLCL